MSNRQALKISVVVSLAVTLNLGVAMSLAFTVAIGLAPTGCSKNYAQRYSPGDKKEESENLMEAGKYAEAAAKLRELLLSEPKNYEARSLYAASLAAQGGVVLVDLILKAASEKDNANEESGGGQAQIENLLPSSTATNISWVRKGSTEMRKIPKVSRTAPMNTQLSVLLLFQSFMTINYLKANPAKLAGISESDAKALLQDIVDSAAAATGSSGGEAANPLSSVALRAATKIGSAEGSTSKAKLSSFVAQN